MTEETHAHPPDTTIDAYAEGLLAGDERARVDEHLCECARCRDEVARQSALISDLRALPRGIPPGVDLRPALHAEIARRAAPRRHGVAALRALRVPLAAAAVLIVAATAGITALMLSESRSAEVVAIDPAAASPRAVSQVDFQDSRSDYVRTAAELTDALARHRGSLAPETVALVEENLRTIDRALREADQALRDDPAAAPVLRELILATHERKVEVLRWAISL